MATIITATASRSTDSNMSITATPSTTTGNNVRVTRLEDPPPPISGSSNVSLLGNDHRATTITLGDKDTALKTKKNVIWTKTTELMTSLGYTDPSIRTLTGNGGEIWVTIYYKQTSSGDSEPLSLPLDDPNYKKLKEIEEEMQKFHKALLGDPTAVPPFGLSHPTFRNDQESFMKDDLPILMQFAKEKGLPISEISETEIGGRIHATNTWLEAMFESNQTLIENKRNEAKAAGSVSLRNELENEIRVLERAQQEICKIRGNKSDQPHRLILNWNIILGKEDDLKRAELIKQGLEKTFLARDHSLAEKRHLKNFFRRSGPGSLSLKGIREASHIGGGLLLSRDQTKYVHYCHINGRSMTETPIERSIATNILKACGTTQPVTDAEVDLAFFPGIEPSSNLGKELMKTLKEAAQKAKAAYTATSSSPAPVSSTTGTP